MYNLIESSKQGISVKKHNLHLVKNIFLPVVVVLSGVVVGWRWWIENVGSHAIQKISTFVD